MFEIKNQVKGRIFSLEDVRVYLKSLYDLISDDGSQIMAIVDNDGNCRMFLDDCFVDFSVSDYDRKKGGIL